MFIVLRFVRPHMWAFDVLRKETNYGTNVSPALAEQGQYHNLFAWQR